MRRILFIAAASLAYAQGPPSAVYVSAPQSRIVSGEDMQLSVIARDARFEARDSDTFVWVSNNTAVLSVDRNGTVKAGRPGLADITAASGSIRGTLRLQVLPLRIEITPRDAQLKVGQSQEFTAVALDIDEKPIPDVAFNWQVTGATGNTTVAATISRAGLLSASAVGQFTVSASIAYGGGTQFVNQFTGRTHCEARRAPEFRLSRLVSTELTRNSFTLRPRIVPLSANDNGQVALVGSLDGISTGLLLYDNGRFDVLTAAGTPAALAGGYHFDYSSLSLNNRGQVLARVETRGAGAGLVLASREGWSMLMIEGQSGGGIEGFGGLTVTRHSLNDFGQVVFRASFRFSGATAATTAIFAIANGAIQMIWNSADSLGGLNAPLAFDNDFGIDNDGVIYFRAASGGRRAIFRADGAGRPVRLIGTGDALAGTTVRNFLNATAVGRSGPVALAVDTAAGTQFIVRFPKGNPAVSETLPVSQFSAVFSVHAASGLAFTGNVGRGSGLHRWPNGGAAPVLLTGAASPDGQPVRTFDAAGVGSDGSIVTQIRTATSDLVVLRTGIEKTLLYQAGSRVNVTANLLVQNLVQGARLGPPHVFMGGPQAGVAEASAGAVLPKFAIGDALLSGVTFPGTTNVRKNALGDLYFPASNAMYRHNGSRLDAVMRYPATAEDGVTLFAPGTFAVNASGVFVSTNSAPNHLRLSITQSGRMTALANTSTDPRWQTPSPAGGIMTGFADVAIDDNGRVMANALVGGGPRGLFLCSNGKWQTAAQFGTTKIGDLPVVSANTLRGANNDFYAILNLSSGGVIAVYRDQTWTPLVQRGDATPFGNTVTGINSYDVNRQGDIVFTGSIGNVAAIAMRTANGNMRIVQMASEAAAQGDYFRSYSDIDLRDDRRVYFLGLDFQDRNTLYLAEPLF